VHVTGICKATVIRFVQDCIIYVTLRYVTLQTAVTCSLSMRGIRTCFDVFSLSFVVVLLSSKRRIREEVGDPFLFSRSKERLSVSIRSQMIQSIPYFSKFENFLKERELSEVLAVVIKCGHIAREHSRLPLRRRPSGRSHYFLEIIVRNA
jgi:hypothetical protein